ncbi:TonB-dependent receptor [Nostoc sp. 3335mG]|nr:TonB-dependent receptor [Nostoc sp. 3335mG]
MGLYNKTSQLIILMAATSALVSIAPAFAQSAIVQPAAATTSPIADSGLSGDIVVTARKKNETLLNVPVSVTALRGDQLERAGVKSVSGLIGTVPSLFQSQNTTFGPSPNQTFLVIRGVGATASNDPAVGTFVDGVYQPSLAFDSTFLDVQRVEVLRGPQGALFGRNTEGGAVSISTVVPGNETHIKLLAEGGSFNTFNFGGTVSTPIVADKLFVGLSGQYSHTDGYLENVTLGEHQDNSNKYAIRGTLRATPTDNLEIVLRGGYSKDKLGYAGFGVPDDGSHRYITLDEAKIPSHATTYNASGTVNYTLGKIKLTSITGFNKTKTYFYYDFDSAPYLGNFEGQQASQRLFSEELRASGSIGSHIDWLIGYYHFNEVYNQNRRVMFLTCGACTVPAYFNPGNNIHDETTFDRTGDAGFGQIIVHPVRKLDVTFGARYSTEDSKARQAGTKILPGVNVNNIYDGSFSDRFNNFSPSGSIAYHWTPDLTTYVTVSKGFKPGGFDKFPGSSAAIGIPFRSETSTNYEAGIKAKLLDGRLYIQTDGFYVKLNNQQLATSVVSPVTGLPVGATANVGRSSSRGFEFEGTFNPVRELRLSVNTAYVDATFDHFDAKVGTLVAGDSFPFVPKWTVAAQAEYTQHVTDKADLTYGLSFKHVGAHYNGTGAPPFDPVLQVPSYSIIDAKITFHQGPVDLTVYVNNIANKFAITSKYQPPLYLFMRDTVLPPRQFGARATLSF